MDKIKVFMVMPFANNAANEIYTHSIIPICSKFNLDIRRGDQIYGTSAVYDDIYKEIHDASIIIVDISGKNPNVFYELGMAHTLKQNRTVIITQDNFENTPFDIAHFRIIDYKDSIVGKADFEQKLERTIQNLLTDRTESFKEEFSLTATIFESTKKHAELLSLIGLRIYKGPIYLSDKIYVEGDYPGGESSASSLSASDLYKKFKDLGYVSFEGDKILLTEKGNAFVDYLEGINFKCNLYNDQIFVENYESLFTRQMKKYQDKSLE